MKINKMKVALAVFLFVVSPIIFSCDTSTKNHPVVFINVTIPQTVDQTQRLYIVFHFMSDWNSPWLTLSYDSKVMVIPPLNIGKVPLYFEIIYDLSGTGILNTVGNYYQGWNGKINRAVPDLNAFIIPDVPIMILNVAMDQAGVNYNTF
jgi:hypothetical protein